MWSQQPLVLLKLLSAHMTGRAGFGPHFLPVLDLSPPPCPPWEVDAGQSGVSKQ